MGKDFGASLDSRKLVKGIQGLRKNTEVCHEKAPPKEVINCEQPDRRPLANRKQSVSNPLAIREQTVSNPLAIREQTVSNPLAGNDNILPQPLAKKVVESPKPLAGMLVSGKEKLLSLYLVRKRINEGTPVLSPTLSADLMGELSVNSNRLRNLFSRLKDKGFIKILESRSGRYASRVIEVTDLVFHSLKEEANPLASGKINPLARGEAYPLAQINPPDITSSSINNTTTKDSKINTQPLAHLGFNEKQLKKILDLDMLSEEDIQKSIDHFAFDLRENNKEKDIKKSPLGFFMGILLKGTPYTPPKNYKTEKTLYCEAIVKSLQKEQKAVKDIQDLKFEVWVTNLPEKEKQKIVPKNIQREGHKQTKLKDYFIENIFSL